MSTPPKSLPRKKHPKKTPQPRAFRKRGWMLCGFDTSMSSIAGAAIGYDATLKKYVGPEFIYLRWSKEDEYFDRLREAARPEELVHELQNRLKLVLNTDEIWIAQEEPVPMGMFARGVSAFLKQQCEISGAFLGGLVRYGYTHIHQMGSIQWRKMIADDLGITTHHSKWRDPQLALQYNCRPTDSGKFRAKQWGLGPFMGSFYQDFQNGNGFPNEVPDWPDIVKTRDGQGPRPENSKAKAIQPDDRYDALAIMWAEALELKNLEIISW